MFSNLCIKEIRPETEPQHFPSLRAYDAKNMKKNKGEGPKVSGTGHVLPAQDPGLSLPFITTTQVKGAGTDISLKL